ncbi:MAG: SDR family NAD(P)-dependent oxidoreductase [Acidimicrobiales bacterium]
MPAPLADRSDQRSDQGSRQRNDPIDDPGANAVAIVGVGAILPDAPDVATFWDNVAGGRYSIRDVDPARWDPDLYFDADPKAPEKTYSKIGGWVRDWEWNPLGWRLPVPPTVSDAMDDAQKWGVACARMALLDYGWPDRALDGERTAVIVGNAMAGEKHYLTALRIAFPELARDLEGAPSFAALDPAVRSAVEAELHAILDDRLPPITEDTMPGELGNILAGRIANLFDLHGPNFVTDAACASAMAAFDAAIDGLLEHEFDVALAGGIDRNMGAATFVKFCKIGALSATGTRPYADGADGFVMGEGAALFVLKRVADAERDGDRIYAVVRAIAGSSDGKGKGITAPNPVGQVFAVERAWRAAGLSPAACGLVEGHGTSTRVGDVVEVTSLGEAFAGADLPVGSVALGSVKSNIGHLKGAAGAAGLLKATLALHHRQLPPSLNFAAPNPNLDFGSLPFKVNTELRDWEPRNGDPRVAAVSAFGFGGTNFHAVLEEHVPGRLSGTGRRTVAVGADLSGATGSAVGGSAAAAPAIEPKAPLRGALVVGAADEAGLRARLEAVKAGADAGRTPPVQAPDEADLRAAERIAIDFGDAAELADKVGRALDALAKGIPAAWKVLRGKGIFRGAGPAPTTAFLFTGQGSQYVNMLADLCEVEPIVADTFAEADAIMRPFLDGHPLTEFVFADPDDEAAVAAAEEQLRQTEITQPAVLTVDAALTRLLAAYGIVPDLVMGHSLGEYGALTAAGALDFSAALEAVSARGREMASIEVEDNGALAAVLAPLDEAERLVEEVDGYVVLANVNSTSQTVVGGATEAVERAIALCEERGYRAMRLPVSHAFHTAIVAPASEPLRATLARLHLHPPSLPIVANVTGELYPMGPDVPDEMLDLLARQVASPVQFVKGLHTLFDAGARCFVEVGPKRALQGFASDVLGDDDVLNLATNQPKHGGVASFNHALCGLYAAGLGVGRQASAPASSSSSALAPPPAAAAASTTVASVPVPPSGPVSDATYAELGHLFADVLDRARQVYGDGVGSGRQGGGGGEPVVITGAALGLPGTARIFDDANVARILHGQQLIDVIPSARRNEIAERHITRLVKGDDGSAVFESIDSPADVIKLAGRGGAFDLADQFGVDADRIAALGRDTQLAIAAGLDALRDAGLPLVQHYKTTTTGSRLPDRWLLPPEVADTTGIIFASAFPGLDAFADDLTRFFEDRSRRDQIADLEQLRARLVDLDGEGSTAVAELDRHLHDLRLVVEDDPYTFDRRFLFRILSMGHSQLAELIGARGPNTQVNAACASTTQAVGLAEDWIRAGRCRRVVIVAADDATSDHLLGWIGAGFLASGAAATDEVVEEAALPFDQRRHGMILGMGAAALVVEAADAARERGIAPICEVLGVVTANSAFHGTRLDVDHIASVMEAVVAEAEASGHVDRHAMAAETVFVSHETYTPARGGSAAAEIHALREVFGADADRIVIANTKGFTGHPMGVGIEDVVAVKALETGLVPPVPNVRDIDPDLGDLNLSKGGVYPVRYALRLAAGFGSQIAMSLLRWTPVADGRHRNPEELGYGYRIADPAAFHQWLIRVSGEGAPELEVVQRRLRVVDHGTAARRPALAPAPAVTSEPATTPASSAPAVVEPATPPAAPAAPAPVEPPPVAAPEPAPVGSEGGDPVAAAVLEVVAAQTGYPPDLLDLDLDLEADLGIDTVKQAEVFASIREAYGIERDESLKLRDYPTLAHVIGFVRDRAPAGSLPAAMPSADPVPAGASSPAPSSTDDPSAVTAGAGGSDDVEAAVLAVVAAQTGYPPDLLDLDLDLEADLGIDTVKQAEVFASIREAYGIERDESLKLRDYPTLAHVIGFVRDRAPAGSLPAASTAPAGAVPQPTSATTDPAGAAAGAGGSDDVEAAVLAVVAAQTGYPPDLLDLDLDLEADLGIDTVKQAEVFASIREAYGIERDESLKLRDYPTLAHVIGFVRDRAPAGSLPAASTAAPASVPAPAAAAPAAAPAGAVSQPTSATTDPAGAAADAGGSDDVEAAVLAVVAAQTGYPPDLLDLDLDLEADLGIDTVKQAEVFASIREAYGIERDESLKLRDYPTLAHVIGFVRDRMPAAATTTTPASTTGGAATEPAAADLERVADDPAFPRRVPVPVLRPPVEACGPTGVTVGAGTRVVLVPDHGGVGVALTDRLAAAGAEVLVVDDAPTAGELEERLAAWTAEAAGGPVTGVVWLAALDDEGPLADLDAATWKAALHVRVKLLAVAMRALADQVAGPGTFLLTATRLGGLHGFDEAGATSPLGGAVTGFTKALSRERPDALVKVVDTDGALSPADHADLLLAELAHDPATVEVGRAGGRRWGIGLAEVPAVHDPARDLGADDVVVVTGAAGSIVSAITADLAAASGATFHLLDLVAAPDPADPDLDRFVSDPDGLKRDLATRIADRGDRPTPKLIERELAGIERARAALAAIDAVAAAGGTAVWHQVDLTDGAAVAAVVDRITADHARVDELLHCAGLEISHVLPDKPQAEYDLVFDVKADGFFHLLSALGTTPLGSVVVFSSIAGRFGNGGQTDYSAANDLMAKVMSSFRTTRPDTRGIAVDWTAWASIGMASRGSIPKMMALAGIDMLPPEVGIPVVRRELTAGGRGGEVVEAGALGVLLEERPLVVASDAWPPTVADAPFAGAVVGSTLADGVVVAVTVGVDQPFLDDHRIDGTPVLPGVMAIEAFAEVAARLAPDLHLRSITDVDFSAPCKLYRDEPRTLEVHARAVPEGAVDGDGDGAGDGGLAVACRLVGRRSLPSGDTETVHTTAIVHLGPVLLEAPPAPASPPAPTASAVGPDAVYGVYFHGPAYQVLGAAWSEPGTAYGRLADGLGPNHRPEDARLVTAPRLLELCFQTAGIVELGTEARMGLPTHLDRLVLFPGAGEGEGVTAVVTPLADGAADAVVVGPEGRVWLRLEGYRTIALPGAVDEAVVAPLRPAVGDLDPGGGGAT